jgi:acyl-coenzyme A synthetase/AMP-(fatty) acid ligase
MLKRIKFENMQLPSLSSITQAGGSLDQKLTQHFYKISQKKNFSFHVMYGQTEASPRISHVPYSMLSKKMGSIGIPVPGGKLRITKDGKPENEAGKQGEIVYEGPNVMLGYGEKRIDLNNGDNLNGVLYTGDTGYFDEDGYFFLVGRLKRMIKIFGQRVNLDEIENMLEIYSGKDVACFGEEDKLYVISESDDESDNLNIINKLTSLYHIHHSAIKSFCVDSLVYKSSGKKDYQALKMKINNETN